MQSQHPVYLNRKNRILSLKELIERCPEIRKPRTDLMVLNIGAGDVASQSFPKAIRDILANGGAVTVIEFENRRNETFDVSPLHSQLLTVINVSTQLWGTLENLNGLIEIWKNAGKPFVMIQNFACKDPGGFFGDELESSENASSFSLITLIDRFLYYIQSYRLEEELIEQGIINQQHLDRNMATALSTYASDLATISRAHDVQAADNRTCLVSCLCRNCTRRYRLDRIYEAARVDEQDQNIRMVIVNPKSYLSDDDFAPLARFSPPHELQRYQAYCEKSILNSQFIDICGLANDKLSSGDSKNTDVLIELRDHLLQHPKAKISLADTEDLGIDTRVIMPRLLDALLERQAKNSVTPTVHEHSMFFCCQRQVQNHFLRLGFSEEEISKAHDEIVASYTEYDMVNSIHNSIYPNNLIQRICSNRLSLEADQPDRGPSSLAAAESDNVTAGLSSLSISDFRRRCCP
ncbi:MAG: hypothetical protein VXZ73_04180 [Pseudomonadota bacterium]|nr:hypothetical protein [Pseudomonadota bacterium]